jgi:hypothetical protein
LYLLRRDPRTKRTAQFDLEPFAEYLLEIGRGKLSQIHLDAVEANQSFLGTDLVANAVENGQYTMRLHTRHVVLQPFGKRAHRSLKLDNLSLNPMRYVTHDQPLRSS